MPGTTRYSATFDRTYEEEDPPPGPPVTRRSRSMSLQMDARLSDPRAPLFAGPLGSHIRSSSTENGAKAVEAIPTRSAGKGTVKAHNNPFQFVKVAPPCPIYTKTEDQLKKTQVKKPPVLKEEEEDEWQSNLDSWKTRRRKMSEGAFLRQEELRRLQMEEESSTEQQQQKKIKKFSEIVEERATRGRALSLCLFSNPLDSTDWLSNNNKKLENGDLLSEESTESSNMNSDDDTDACRKGNSRNNNTAQTNSIQNSTSNSSISKTSDLSEFDISQESLLQKDNQNIGGNGFVDSGLESLSSSHRVGDIPDSGSDFSQDSGSGIDCDSPHASGLITTGIELLEEFSSKEKLDSSTQASSQSKDKTKLSSTSSLKKVKPAEGKKVTSIMDKLEKKSSRKNGVASRPCSSTTKSSSSLESENEMFVDDFEELARMKTLETATLNGNLSSKESLNIIYQSKPHNGVMMNGNKTENVPKKDFSLISEVPVDKVTEEMEKMILAQLEEEERTKEIMTDSEISIPEVKGIHELPLRNVQPPKEKPPPPPEDSPLKDSSIKRVNSTKRILKEINKRRTDFLGIENSNDRNALCELSLPPPPALEDLLRAEREQDLQRSKISILPIIPLEEEEIVRKEREIIENLETEERIKTSQVKDEVQSTVPDFTNARIEEKRIQQLKEERKKMEDELLKAEAEKSRIEETLQLQRREELVRKQEADDGNNNNFANETLAATGDGKTNLGSVVSSSTSTALANGEGELKKCPPLPPPKPIKKKKEALRKERERLRQEQEELQREREEHRKKIQLEQEQLQKQQQQQQNSSKPHVPLDVPIRIGPPTLAKPTPSSSQELTSPSSSISSSLSSVSSILRDSANVGSKRPVSSPIIDSVTASKSSSLQSRPAVSRGKVNSAESRPQPKANSQRKQESIEQQPRYNQNHWLIQEAEMRRIAEQKERQRIQNHPQRLPLAQTVSPVCAPDQLYGQPFTHGIPPGKMCVPVPHLGASGYLATYSTHIEPNSVPSAKTSRKASIEKPEQILSVSGRKRCSHCGEELGRGAAMIIESLQLYYHIQCFQCCVCQTQLGNGLCGTDVRVRNNKLHCHNCYSNDEAGLKFSQV